MELKSLIIPIVTFLCSQNILRALKFYYWMSSWNSNQVCIFVFYYKIYFIRWIWFYTFQFYLYHLLLLYFRERECRSPYNGSWSVPVHRRLVHIYIYIDYDYFDYSDAEWQIIYEKLDQCVNSGAKVILICTYFVY